MVKTWLCFHWFRFSQVAQWKEAVCQCRRCGFDLWISKIPWKWQPSPIFSPGKFHGQRSLVGYSPRGHQESNVTEQPSMQAHIKLWIPTVDSNEKHISTSNSRWKKNTKDATTSAKPLHHSRLASLGQEQFLCRAPNLDYNISLGTGSLVMLDQVLPLDQNS